MSRKETSARQAGYFGEQQQGGRGRGTERTTDGVQSHRANNNYSTPNAQRAKLAERRRAEQQCRDYWRRMYGTRAEIASRGGVSWIGGVRRV